MSDARVGLTPTLAALWAALWLAASAAAPAAAPGQEAPRQKAHHFEVTYGPGLGPDSITGRLVLFVARSPEPEPRLRLSPDGPAVFGVSLEGLRPGETAVVDGGARGYPQALSRLEPGTYHVQAVVNLYERVRRADGHTLWLPFSDGRRAFFPVRAGNPYSDVRRVEIKGGADTTRLRLSSLVPERSPPEDTRWVKHVELKSDTLSRFWGRPVQIHAKVLLPRGYRENSARRYPVVFTLGHDVPFSFTSDSAGLEDVGEVDPESGLRTGYDFYRAWTSDDFPRMVAVSLHQQTPYFPDSYSVNSVNNGPYGDAVTEEVIPALEERFRIRSRPWARLVEGASTGGWQALALQLRHPETFGGAWVLQPDPIDFRSFQLVNLYEDSSAFVRRDGPFTTSPRLFRRTTEGQPEWTVRELSRFESVLGTKGRSGYQIDGWEAVFGPTGPDGYPRSMWDPRTGEIDREVVRYMREHGFDLRAYAARNWETLEPKLRGKLHLFAGDMDQFFLNLAVYRFEEFLDSASSPGYKAEFTYGRPKKGHGWHQYTWAELVRRMAEHVQRRAPEGTDPFPEDDGEGLD